MVVLSINNATPAGDLIGRLPECLRGPSRSTLSEPSYRGERGGRSRLTGCQATRANAGTLTSRLVRSEAAIAQRSGARCVSEGAAPAGGRSGRLRRFDGPLFRGDEERW
jgi:hypothetical protein